MKPLIAVAVLWLLAGCTMTTGATGPVPHATFTPAAGTRWQIQLSGAFDGSVAANVYDLDPYTTPEATVAAIEARGARAICHLDAGAADMTLPDAATVPAEVLGEPDGTQRRWLDIRNWAAIRPVLAARFELCRAKGFQGVDADETYGYENPTGFDLTSADQITYDRQIADLAHEYGLAAGVRTRPAMARSIEPFVDFTVVDGCFTTPDCADYFAFVDANKAVYDVETGAGTRFCTLARVYGFAAIRKPDDDLDGRVINC